MMLKRISLAVVVAAFLVTYCRGGELPPRPEFDSVVVVPEDSGKVKPVDIRADRPMKIAVIGMEVDSFWILAKEGVAVARKELEPLNCQVDWIVPAGDKHTSDFFGTAIESCIVQQYDAISTVAGDSGLINYINQAVDAGIPVATYNVETTEPNKRLCFVGCDLYRQGYLGAQAMAKRLDGKGKVAVLAGFFSVEGHEAIRMGFENGLKEFGPDIEIVGRVETLDKTDVAYSQVMDFFTAFPDLDGIYVCAGGQIGAAAAVEESGMAGKVVLVTLNETEDIVEYVDRGVITVTIGQDPYAQGHDPVIRLYNYLVGGVVPPAARLFTNSPEVTQEVAKQYLPK